MSQLLSKEMIWTIIFDDGIPHLARELGVWNTIRSLRFCLLAAVSGTTQRRAAAIVQVLQYQDLSDFSQDCRHGRVHQRPGGASGLVGAPSVC